MVAHWTRPRGQKIDPAPGVWFITKFISFTQVVSGLVWPYSAESWPKIPVISFHFCLIILYWGAKWFGCSTCSRKLLLSCFFNRWWGRRSSTKSNDYSRSQDATLAMCLAEWRVQIRVALESGRRINVQPYMLRISMFWKFEISLNFVHLEANVN